MRGFQEVFPRRRDRHISRTCGELAEPGREEGPGDASREAARSEPAPGGRRRAARGRKPPSGSRARWRERRGSRGTLADGDCGGEPHSLMGAARRGAVPASGSSGGHGALAGGAARATGRHARWPGPRGGGRLLAGAGHRRGGAPNRTFATYPGGKMAQNDSLVSAKQCQSFADLAFLGLLQSRVDIGGSIEAPNSLYATEMFCSMSQTGCLVLLSQLRAAWG